jgi:RluA family pseudouridine synthase
MPMQVLLEDPCFRVLHKPSGISVLKDNTGGASVPDLYREQFGEAPLFVHRIDKGTSGVLLIARTPQAHATLSRAFSKGEVHKTYLALVEGALETEEILVDRPLEKARKGAFRIAPEGRGLPCETLFKVLACLGDRSLLTCEPLTGRTHQIRIHLASIGHPLVKDPLYGHHRARPSLEQELTLHAWRMRFPHPLSGEAVEAEAPVPEWAGAIG